MRPDPQCSFLDYHHHTWEACGMSMNPEYWVQKAWSETSLKYVCGWAQGLELTGGQRTRDGLKHSPSQGDALHTATEGSGCSYSHALSCPRSPPPVRMLRTLTQLQQTPNQDFSQTLRRQEITSEELDIWKPDSKTRPNLEKPHSNT